MARRPKALSPLNPQEMRFCHEYLVDGVASRAAERAGYRPARGSTLRKDPRIKEMIAALQRQTMAEVSLTRGKIVEGLLKETTGPSHNGRVAAWIALARVAGLFVEKHDIRGTIDVNQGTTIVYLPDNGRGDRAEIVSLPS